MCLVKQVKNLQVESKLGGGVIWDYKRSICACFSTPAGVVQVFNSFAGLVGLLSNFLCC